MFGVLFEDNTESISSASLKNSSFLRWKRTSTLLTAKYISFNINRLGFGSNRIRYSQNGSNKFEVIMKGKRAYRITRKYSVEFTLRKYYVIIDYVSDTWHKKDDAAGRQIEPVTNILCELRTENLRWSGINIAIFDARMPAVYEGSNLFGCSVRSKGNSAVWGSLRVGEQLVWIFSPLRAEYAMACNLDPCQL